MSKELKNQQGKSLIQILVIVIIMGTVLSMLGAGLGSLSVFYGSTHEGRVSSCEKLQAGYMAEGNKMFSFSIELDKGHEYLNFSSEDRQFGSIGEGDSVKVKVFKYPFWNFKNAGTYHGGRLLKKFK